MNRTELLNLVRTTSLNLMNACEGDGTIYACYGDDEIIAEFPGLMTKAQVIAKVRKMDSATADHLNEVLMFSGEYEMVNGVAVSKYELERQAELAHKAEADTDADGEAYGEFVMNWVMGGGLASDAPQAWRQKVLGEEPVPYYMDMTPEERERDNIRFEMEQEGW
jgi:hypothetical protein